MEFALVLPHMGAHADAAFLVEAAVAAERHGLAAVWVHDRLLWPVAPSTPFPGRSDGRMPGFMRRVFEPLVTLTFVAAHTTRVRLGTGVLVPLFRSPVALARQVATLDVLSGGRLILGVGTGWSADEYAAAGVPMARRDSRTDECLRLLRCLWSEEQPAFSGQFYRVPRCVLEPRPLQRPHPPLYIGGVGDRALRRAARLGDGWYASGWLTLDRLTERVERLWQWVEAEGRDPTGLSVASWAVLRFQVEAGDLPLVGPPDRILEGLAGYARAGVGHLALELGPRPEQVAESLQRFAEQILPEVGA